MNKELVVNRSLYHLLEVLFDLDNYQFDNDVVKILNDLKTLVDSKIYSSFNFEDSIYQLEPDLVLLFKPVEKK